MCRCPIHGDIQTEYANRTSKRTRLVARVPGRDLKSKRSRHVTLTVSSATSKANTPDVLPTCRGHIWSRGSESFMTALYVNCRSRKGIAGYKQEVNSGMNRRPEISGQ